MKEFKAWFILILFIGISMSAYDKLDDDVLLIDYFSEYREVIGIWDAPNWNSLGMRLNADKTCKIY